MKPAPRCSSTGPCSGMLQPHLVAIPFAEYVAKRPSTAMWKSGEQQTCCSGVCRHLHCCTNSNETSTQMGTWWLTSRITRWPYIYSVTGCRKRWPPG